MGRSLDREIAGSKSVEPADRDVRPWIIGLRTRPGPPGFTLIELVVVLVIISVMVGLVGPRLAGSLTNTNLKTASKKTAAVLRYARSRAISECTPYVVHFDLDEGRMVMEGGKWNPQEGEDEAGMAEGSIRSQHVYRLPEDVRFERAIWEDEANDAGLFRILFVPNGGSSGGELVLANKRGHHYWIVVDMITGSVKVRGEESEG